MPELNYFSLKANNDDDLAFLASQLGSNGQTLFILGIQNIEELFFADALQVKKQFVDHYILTVLDD